MPLSEKSAHVVRFVRKLRGGSQPILVEADDGKLYVLKFLNNVQGPNLLFNESIGTELYHLAKLPVPRWRPLILSASFIDENPGCSIESEDGEYKPFPGVCFGSRFLGNEDRRVYELLPGSFCKRLTNIDDFWGAWLLDVCCDHADNRQALFPSGFRGSFHAVFIDHGHMFGGPEGMMYPHFVRSKYLDPRFYVHMDAERMARLKKVAHRLDVDQLWRKAHNLPQEWLVESALHRFSKCLESLTSRATIEPIVDVLVDLNEPALNNVARSGGLVRKPPKSIGARSSGVHASHV